jgi:hypothetical protein
MEWGCFTPRIIVLFTGKFRIALSAGLNFISMTTGPNRHRLVAPMSGEDRMPCKAMHLRHLPLARIPMGSELEAETSRFST